ncbi:MAG: terminase [Armatimonadetes bacterium]|nr:terminase [Armatimonadota bacterium]
MSRLALDLARALDPVALAEGVGMTPDPWQASVLRSDHPRIILNAARQTGKSQTCAVKAVHVAVYEPGSLILLLSPSLRQSQELFKKTLAVYRSLGRPVPSESENALSLTLESGSRVVSLPGTEGTIRAYSAVRLLLIDEAARVPDETIAAVRPMLAVSGGQLIMLSTPFGRRGVFYEAWENGGPTYERYRVPATDCPRITAAFLEEERTALGPWFFDAEYNCTFGSPLTSVFDAEQIAALFNSDPEVETWPL